MILDFVKVIQCIEMDVDSNHDKHEKVSFSAMYFVVFHVVVIDDASIDSFGTRSILIDFFSLIAFIGNRTKQLDIILEFDVEHSSIG